MWDEFGLMIPVKNQYLQQSERVRRNPDFYPGQREQNIEQQTKKQ